jgi:hypothetical protein
MTQTTRSDDGVSASEHASSNHPDLVGKRVGDSGDRVWKVFEKLADGGMPPIS